MGKQGSRHQKFFDQKILKIKNFPKSFNEWLQYLNNIKTNILSVRTTIVACIEIEKIGFYFLKKFYIKINRKI